MTMRAGVTDIKYLDALKAAAGDRDEVKSFLLEAPVRVVERERHDRRTAEKVREEAIRLLMKYVTVSANP